MRGRRFRLKPGALVAASVALIFSQSPSWANPTGPQVVSGTVGISQPGAGILNITNTPGSIINWQGFSIGAGEVTRFIQQSASSSVLNRVIGSNISQINGQLLSNGRVFLVNPGGIIVGPGAIIDTAGFVGSTLNMLDADFLAGKLRFENNGSAGSIVNQGWIRTPYGGQVVLVAPTIENGGLIETPGGELILAAGQKVTISSLNAEGVQFEVQAPTDSVLNVGRLLADGGAVGVFAGTLRHSGEIRANSLAFDEAGRVVLKVQDGIELAPGSLTSADGRTGGAITMQSTGGTTRVAGSVSATGSTGAGGSVHLLGDAVHLVENAAVNASGATGGGQILVGGDYQGANPAIQNSANTFVGPAVTLRADATQNGDGGRVIVWSDDKTQFYGSLSAQGGPNGGNGGFAEVSGLQGLVFEGAANLGAPAGTRGMLLLDPLDLFVFSGGGTDPNIINNTPPSGYPLFPSNAATVSPATLAAITGDVTLHARRYMLIKDAVSVSGALTATVDPYTGAALPVLPDPLALSVSSSSGWINGLHLGANITAGGQLNLTAPTISSVAASTVTSTGAGINLTTTGQAGTSSINLSAPGLVKVQSGSGVNLGTVSAGSVEIDALSTVNTTSITTSNGTVDIDAGFGNIFPGTIAAGSGSVILDGGSISATVNTTGAVTAIGTSSVFIGSSMDLNVANVQSGSTATLQPSGSILGTGSASPIVKGSSVTLNPLVAGAQILGPGGGPLRVEVQGGAFSFSPKGAFIIELAGTLGSFTGTFSPPISGTYSGSLTGVGTLSGLLSLNMSAAPTDVMLNTFAIADGGVLAIDLSTDGTANVPLRIGSVTSDRTGTMTLSSGGAINALTTVSSTLEVEHEFGALNITGKGIGVGGGSFPLDVKASSVNLTSTAGGAIGGAAPVIAETQNLTINARNGSTFNVSTGAASLANLTVTASPSAGSSVVTTNGGSESYSFTVSGGNFTFTPETPTTNRDVTFTATSGDIDLGPVDLGSAGDLQVTAENGAILGSNNISANTLTLNASGAVATGVISAGSVTIFGGSTVDIDDGVTATTGNINIQAFGGLLTLAGSAVVETTAPGRTITLRSSGLTPFEFEQINAGSTGTVNITSSAGIRQISDGASDGITARTVLLTTSGPITNSADVTNSRLDLLGGVTTSLTVDVGGQANFDAHGSVLTNLSITKRALPATAPFELFGLGGSQSLTIGFATEPFRLSLSSPSALNFTLNQTVAANDITIVGTGIDLTGGGGNISLTSAGGITSQGGAPISSAGGNITLDANGGNVSIGSSGITTNGTINVDASGTISVGGNVDAGSGAVFLTAGSSVSTSGGAIISSTNASSGVNVTAGFGNIGAAGAGSRLQITSPTVNLDAIGGTAYADLTDTLKLEVIGEQGFDVSSTNTAFNDITVETTASGTGPLSLAGVGQTFTFARPATDLFGVAGSYFQVVSMGGTMPAKARFTALDGTLLVAGGSTGINVADLSLTAEPSANVSLQGVSGNALSLSSTTQLFDAGFSGFSGDLSIKGAVTLSATGTQSFRAGTNLIVDAGAGGGGAISLSGASQTFSTPSFSGKIEFLGGAAANEKVMVTASGSQSFSGNTLNLTGGGAGSFVEAKSTGGSQSVSISGTAVNTGIQIKGGNASGAYALLQAATSQTNFSGGNLLLEAGDADNASASMIAGTSQTLFPGIVTLTGKTSNALLSATTVQDIFASGPIKLNSTGSGTVGLTSAGSQDIDAQYFEVLTNGSGSAKISAGTTQRLSTLNTTTNPSMKVVAFGSGTASIEAGTAQLIELDYPGQIRFTGRDGRLVIGDAAALGDSLVKSLGSQTVFARSILIQGPAGSEKTSALKAAGAQVITTLQGGISVLAGSGSYAIAGSPASAQIDPTSQSILSNGSVIVQGGSGTNSVAQIGANSGATPNGQTVLTSSGNLTVQGGSTSGAGAFIVNTGSSSFVGGAGGISLLPGSAVGADAIIDVGAGPGTLTAFCTFSSCTLPPAGSGSPVGGIVANGFTRAGGSSSSSSDEVLDQIVTSQILPIPLPLPSSTDDPTVTRRVPTCR